MEECESLETEMAELQELQSEASEDICQDDEDEVEELRNSLREVVQDQSVKPKLQCLMVDPSFSMVTVQSEDSGIVWETASSRCSTPWASETSSTSETYSMEGPGAAGKITIVFDEDKVVRRRTRSGTRSGSSRLGDRLSRPGSSRSASALGVERLEMAEVSLPNVQPEKTEKEPDLEEIKNRDQQLFSLISDGYEILNIRVPCKLPTVDEEESTELQDNLSYLDQTPKIRSRIQQERTLQPNHVLPEEEDTTEESLTQDSARPSSDTEDGHTPTPKESDIDYFEKFTLLDHTIPAEQVPELPPEEQRPSAAPQTEELKPAKEPTLDSPTASEESFVFVTDVDIVGEHLDEVFYGEGPPADTLKRKDEDEADGGSRLRTRRESQRAMKDGGAVLFGSEETKLTPIYISSGPPKIIDPILLEEPTAMSFMYSDLYEDAVGQRQRSDEELSEAESVTSEKSYRRRLSDSDEAEGYLEKFTLKDEIPTVEPRQESGERKGKRRMMWSQSDFDTTGCLTRAVAEEVDKTEEATTPEAKRETEQTVPLEATPEEEDAPMMLEKQDEDFSEESMGFRLTEEVNAKVEQDRTEPLSSSVDGPLPEMKEDEDRREDETEREREEHRHGEFGGSEQSATEIKEQDEVAEMSEVKGAAPESSDVPRVDVETEIQSLSEETATEPKMEDKETEVEPEPPVREEIISSAEPSGETEMAEVVPEADVPVDVVTDCGATVTTMVEVTEEELSEPGIQTQVQIDLKEAADVQTAQEEAPAEGQSPESRAEAHQETEVQTETEVIAPLELQGTQTDPIKRHGEVPESLQQQPEESATDVKAEMPSLCRGTVVQDPVSVGDELIVLVPRGQIIEMDIDIGQWSHKITTNAQALAEPQPLEAPGDKPAEVEEVKPEIVEEVKPEIVQEVEPETVEEVEPETVEEVEPETVEEVEAETVEEVKPLTVEEVEEETVEEVKPEIVQEVEPETVVEVKPETVEEIEPLAEEEVEPEIVEEVKPLTVEPEAAEKVDEGASANESDRVCSPPAAVEEEGQAHEQIMEEDVQEVEGAFSRLRSFTPLEDLSGLQGEDEPPEEPHVEHKEEMDQVVDTKEQPEEPEVESAEEAVIIQPDVAQDVDLHREDVEPKVEEVVPEAPQVPPEELEYELISKQDAEEMPEAETQREEPRSQASGQDREEKMEVEMEVVEEIISPEEELIEADYDIIDAEEEDQARLAAELQGMDRFCASCGDLLSEDDCESGQHQNHEVTTVDSAYEDIKEKLSDWISELQGRSENIEDLVSELELGYNTVEDQCVETEVAMQAQNEEMMAVVMEQYNNMSVSMEEEKKAKLEQLYDQIVSFQESIDTTKATLDTTAREADTDARSPEDIQARLETALDSAMSLELGPKGLLVFEDYAKGNTSGSHHAQRKGIPVPQRPTLQPQEPSSATSTSVTVYWRVNPGDIIDCFQVYCMEDPQGAVSEEYRVTVKESHCVLEELEPDKTYKVWVMAVNYTGCSLPSERLAFHTAPSVPAIDMERCSVMWDSATLRWQKQSPGQSYTLEYCRQYELEGEGLRSISGIRGCEQMVLLQPNENYLFYIKAVNEAGASEQSEAALISTKGTRFRLLKSSAPPELELSEDRSAVHYSPDADETNKRCPSVLGELLPARGRHYWETDVSGSPAYRLGLTFDPADGDGSLGENGGSWCLQCVPAPSGCRYQLLHAGVQSSVFVVERPERVGTLLDHQLGRLSFYNARSGQLLGAFSQRFTRPCHPALGLERPGGRLEVIMVQEAPEFTKDS